jgi:hypothetical protein
MTSLLRRSLTCVCALALTAGLVSAQNNLVNNGSFETGALAPWTVASSVGNVQTQIAQQAAVGATVDRALEVTIDSTSPSLYAIQQDITLPANGYYQLSLSGRRLSGNGSVLLDVAPTTTGWTWGPGAVQENHFVSVGTPVYMPAGQFRCALWLRNELQSKFSVQIDEIVVRQVQLPAMVFDNTRIYAYDVQNRHLLIAYASVQRLSIPITLPGWTGGLDLDPFRMGGLLYVGFGVSDPGRPATLVLLPSSVNTLGFTLYFQCLDISGQVFGSRLALRWRK